MITLTIDNSICNIDGLDIDQFKQVKELLCYHPRDNYVTRYRPSKQYLIDKRGNFPTGLRYLVEYYLINTNLVYIIIDKRIKPKSHNALQASFKYTPYNEQIAAAAACTQYDRGIVVAPTGVGKSLIVALIIRNLQVRTLVVVPSLELKRQLTKTLKEIFTKENIGKDCFINVQNIDALTEENCSGYDCVIIDEFHHSGAKTYRKLNKKAWAKTYYKFGLTATPFRSQDNEKILLESVLDEVIYTIDYKTAVDNGYIVPIEAYYYELPKIKSVGYKWAEIYKELVVDNEYRNELISDLLKMLKHSNISTLCLVKEIAHGSKLSKLSNTHFANGDNDDTVDLISFFNQEKIRTLIGTTGVLGEGVDTKPCEFVIIAGLGKSKNQFMQQCGRSFRKNSCKQSCKVIIFKDNSHRWTRDHFKAQCKYLLDEYGVIPVKLELPT